MTAPKLSERMQTSADAWAEIGYTEQAPSLDGFIAEVAALEQRLEQAEAKVGRLKEALDPGPMPDGDVLYHDPDGRLRIKHGIASDEDYDWFDKANAYEAATGEKL